MGILCVLNLLVLLTIKTKTIKKNLLMSIAPWTEFHRILYQKKKNKSKVLFLR